MENQGSRTIPTIFISIIMILLITLVMPMIISVTHNIDIDEALQIVAEAGHPMGADLDMNNHSVYNVTTLEADTIDSPTGRTATYVIAANDATVTDKNQADYICDGTADEVQIQAAINALPATGGKISLTTGTFNIQINDIDIAESTYLEGIYGSTILNYANTLASAITAANLNFFEISGIKITSSGDGGGTSGVISVSNVKDFTISHSIFDDCGNTSIGIIVENTSDHNNPTRLIEYSTFSNGFVGVRLGGNQQTQYVSLDSNTFVNLTSHGLQSYLAKNNRYTNNEFMYVGTSSGGAIYIHGTVAGDDTDARTIVSQNRFTHIGGEVPTRAAYAIRIDGDQCLVSENEFAAISGNALYITDDVYGLKVINNSFWDNGRYAAGTTASKSHIYINTATSIDISHNTFRSIGNGSYIIYVDTGGSDFLSVKDNNNDGVLPFFLMVTKPEKLWVSGNENYLHSGETRTITEVIDHAAITDNGDATGYFDFAETIPVNVKVLSTSIDITSVFLDTVGNNTSVNAQLGTSVDPDRFDATISPGPNIWNSSTDIYTDSDDFQGNEVTTATTTPRFTFTTDSDMTDLISGTGSQGTMTVIITYRKL